MSGHTEDIVVLDAAREREIHFVQKPFTRDSLLSAVAEALADAPEARAVGGPSRGRRRRGLSTGSTRRTPAA